MNLTDTLRADFTKQVRDRGLSYYKKGAVRIQKGSESSVSAIVIGSRPYTTEIRLDQDGELLARCDCEYFDTDFCKHLWAMLLAAEEAGHLSAAADIPDLYLDFEDDTLPDEDAEDGPYDDQDRPFDPANFRLQMARDGIEIIVGGQQQNSRSVAPSLPAWRMQMLEVIQSQRAARLEDTWPAKRQLHYAVDVARSLSGLCLLLETCDRRADGSWSARRALSLKRDDIRLVPDPSDRAILTMLSGMESYGWGYQQSYNHLSASCNLSRHLAGMVMPMVLRSGRCYLRTAKSSEQAATAPLVWEDEPWHLALQVRSSPKGGWAVTGLLKRGDERMDLSSPVLVREGFVFTRERAAPLADDTAMEWLSYLRRMGRIEAPKEDREKLMEALFCHSGLPPLDLPEDMRCEEVSIQPRSSLRVLAADGGSKRLRAQVSFDYEGRQARVHDLTRGWYEDSRFVRRDFETETAAAARLMELGARKLNYLSAHTDFEIASTKLPRIVSDLLATGWHVEAEGKAFRRPGTFHLEVSSGVDWFELHGEVSYGDMTARLPELLEALRRGETMVRLGNGDYGVLPEEWLHKFGSLTGLGTPENGHIRFRRSQAGLLDALLAAQPQARCDETFARVRQELALFQGVSPAEQPAGFAGHLRDYQREGLAWMHFLRRFSFGGCLADDMGVGKTAQVLALLETRRELRAAGGPEGPSLVVVPKSLVFNWKLEAARFTPQLKVLDYTGLARSGTDFTPYDVVLTTYGTLRRDVPQLKDVKFDYVILDEAQAVKNASTEGAKAVRLLNGGHRLAMSGTPMENHLGELWTLFEFLNPGMLGAASAFGQAGGPARNPDVETRRVLAAALRPFILRRTKEQVARELPAKSEQVIYCEMEAAQRKLYDELLQHYRAKLLRRIDDQGMAKSKIQVLEALLRLRQAACHPGLLDKKRISGPSAKLEMLLEQLREVLAEGHKALVFSQFTSLLAILRERLDSQQVVYEYLNGDTPSKQREERVARFQSDDQCRLFLLSLKAGGLGLNLTSAEYVFLLDPWWNPAVESQAVDRAHRIGQSRQVFAYRLITRDTVEEKVLQLQETKRDLAAAIIGADNSLIRNLRREDLEILLS